MSSNPPVIATYAQAAAFLAAGKRSTVNRPHGHARRIVADLVGIGTISVVYHCTPIVTYLPEGQTVVWFNQHMTKTTLAHIEEYAGLRAQWGTVDGKHQIVRPALLASIELTNRNRQGSGDGYSLAVATPSWPRTPSNIKRCRSCKGKGKQEYSWSAGERECLNCYGEGTKQFGNGLIPLTDDGARPILLGDGDARIVDWSDLDIGAPPVLYECTCKLCGSGASTWQEYYGQQQYYAAQGGNVFDPAPAPKPTGYSNSGAVLTRLLPALRTHTHCPGDDCQMTGEIQAMIIHLNDRHHWTRETIADWLETLDADLAFPANV